MKRTIKITSALGAVLMLSACGSSLDRRPDPTDTFYNKDTSLAVDNQLVVAAGQIQQSLKELNLTNAAAGAPKADAVDVASLPAALQHEVTAINYTGPADNLIQQLANIAGYRFIAPLHAPTVPVMANFTSERTTVGEALQDIGLQIQHQATIIVNPGAQTISLRYDDLGQYVSREKSVYNRKVTGFKTTTSTTTKTTRRHHKHHSSDDGSASSSGSANSNGSDSSSASSGSGNGSSNYGDGGIHRKLKEGCN